MFKDASDIFREVKKEVTDLPEETFVSDGVDILPEEAEIIEIPQIVKNKIDGCRREYEVDTELRQNYPEHEGYQVVKEAYLRDKDGSLVIDDITGEKRRVDFMIIKDGVVVDSIEVTSETASKEEQLEKEERIREKGGNYIRDSEGNLTMIPNEIKTRVERRE